MITITVARKPLSEANVAANILKHGTGALSIDATRVGGGPSLSVDRRCSRLPGISTGATGWTAPARPPERGMPIRAGELLGRWSANLILEHLLGCVRTGTAKMRPKEGFRPNPVAVQSDGNIRFTEKPPGYRKTSYTDDDGMEVVVVWTCADGCPIADLDSQRPSAGAFAPSPVGSRSSVAYGKYSTQGDNGASFQGDAGGASRFFKQVGGRRG